MNFEHNSSLPGLGLSAWLDLSIIYSTQTRRESGAGAVMVERRGNLSLISDTE